MTAYSANFLIKGYASVGDMGHAREIFELLSNPRGGVAGPNNHAPYTPEEGQSVPVIELVYREVSFFFGLVGVASSYVYLFFFPLSLRHGK